MIAARFKSVGLVAGVAIAALVVIAVWIVLVNHWLVIPGIN